MDPTPIATIVFADAKVGAAFLLALSLGLLVVCGVFLLRPWPPKSSRALVFAPVFAICGAVMFYALLEHKLIVDPSKQQVAQSSRVLGIGRQQVWAFGEFQGVRVEFRGEPQGSYAVELVGVGTNLRLKSYGDAFEAERTAVNVARAGGWPARRHGYRLRAGSGQADDGIAAGELQTFETPSGQQGIGVSLESWTQVQIEDGAESAIETSR